MARSRLTGVAASYRKLAWGARQVGFRRTAAGLARLAVLAVRRPECARIRTARDRLSVSFRYPSQLIPTLVVFGDLLEPELRLLGGMLGPGRVAIDVGASIGTWTLSAARTGASVYACEPDAVNFGMLEANIRANGMGDHVSAHALALGQQNGRGALVAAERRYLNRVAQAAGGTGRDFPVATLDRFAAEMELDCVDVLKINTAGDERAVVLGAMRLFRARRVRLAMVLDGLDVRPLLLDLRACSYDIGIYDGTLGRFVGVRDSADLDRARPSPMNHYIIVRRHESEPDWS